MIVEQGAGSKEPGAAGFRRLVAWQRADDLASAAYELGNLIPARDQWLRVQLLKAASSVSSNIAEGHGRGTLRDYIRFLEMAISSLNEVESQLHFMRRNEIVVAPPLEATDSLRLETGKLLFGLLRAMRSKLNGGGDWQRHQIGEERIEYGADLEPNKLAPGSLLLAPGGNHG